MVPSLKFTLIAWLAIIGFGSLLFFLRDKKDPARIHLSNTATDFATVEPLKPNGRFRFLTADKLITSIQQESKNLPVYILINQLDYWKRVSWNDQFSRAIYTHRQHQYAGWLNAQWYTPRNVVMAAERLLSLMKVMVWQEVNKGPSFWLIRNLMTRF